MDDVPAQPSARKSDALENTSGLHLDARHSLLLGEQIVTRDLAGQ